MAYQVEESPSRDGPETIHFVDFWQNRIQALEVVSKPPLGSINIYA